MPIEICAVGGYKEVGGNCTAIKVDDEVILLDMGLHMENYVKYMEDEDIQNVTARQLASVNAIPNLNHIKDWKSKVKAITPSHAHLDHVGAAPFIASQLDAPIVGTPFTIEVIKAVSKDAPLKNKLIKINPNDSYKVSKNITIEFIHVTHSTPQSSIVAIHTPYGTVLYASDFKFDNSPTLESKPNYKRLKQLKGKVALLVTECLYAGAHQKMPSEAVARQMLKEVMLETDSRGKAMIVTTFSSHIARLKSIIEFGKRTGRKIVFLGRSLDKYITAAERVGIVNFKPDIGMIYYGKRAQRELKKMGPNKERYLLVMTGHQGEPKAMLSRIVDNQFKFPLEAGDLVIFSCRTIPSPTTIANRKILETKLKDRGVRMFTDIHVSGHAAREEIRELIEMTEPHHIMPTHGNPNMLAALADLAAEMGYPSKKIHVVANGKRFNVD